MQLEHDNNSQGYPAFNWAAATDKGKQRDENEDAFFVEEEIGLFLVSDGMGGHRGGALASKIVAEDMPVAIEASLDKLKGESTQAVRQMFGKIIIDQSKHLLREGESESGYKDMGATVVVAMIRAGRAYIAGLGDSRVYLFRAEKLKQITKDHSVVSELIEEGHIEPEEAADHEATGQLTHYIGMDDEAEPFVRTFVLEQRDKLLLCTDGLTDMVDDETIGGVLQNGQNCPEICKELVSKANKAGGHDNITVVVVEYKRKAKTDIETPPPIVSIGH